MPTGWKPLLTCFVGSMSTHTDTAKAVPNCKLKGDERECSKLQAVSTTHSSSAANVLYAQMRRSEGQALHRGDDVSLLSPLGCVSNKLHLAVAAKKLF